jgi:hypothetical protein
MALKRIEPLHELPPQQKKALTFIAWCIQHHRVSPLQKEVAKAINVRGGSAWLYTEPLVIQKYLKKIATCGKRNLRLDDLAYEVLSEKDLEVWNNWWEKQRKKVFWKSFMDTKRKN